MINKNEQAYQTIKEEILTGVITQDTPLSEQMLVDRLGISRTPIRTALQRLQVEGFIKVIPNQGIVIREISLKEATELYDLRRVVEEYLINQSVKLLTDKDFLRLDAYVEEQEEALRQKDFHLYLKYDSDMHLYCYRYYENDAMKEILQNYRERLYSVRYQTCQKNQRIDEHRKFIKALREQDADKACEILREHINKGIMANIR